MVVWRMFDKVERKTGSRSRCGTLPSAIYDEGVKN